MWREEYFEYESESFSFPRRMVTPKPYQDPHPPAWMAATSQSSATTAGENGLGLLSFTIMQPIEMMAKAIEMYRAAQINAKPLTDVQTNKVAAYTLVHCAEDEAQLRANGLYESIWPGGTSTWPSSRSTGSSPTRRRKRWTGSSRCSSRWPRATSRSTPSTTPT